jgi:uncharacterized protein (UPF0335 family)
MLDKTSSGQPAQSAALQDAADLLQALESLREEIGTIADDIIDVLREAGVTPAQEPAQAPKSN